MRTSTQSVYESSLTKVVNHILSSLDQALDIESLAHVGGFSTYHFHRVFRGMLGETVMEMVRRLRLERAAHMLFTENQSILETAIENGYESGEALTRAFRNGFGASPSDIRRRQLVSHRIPTPNRVHFEPDRTDEAIPCFVQGELSMEIEFRNLPARKAIVMAHSGPYWQIGTTFGKFMAWAGPALVPMQESVAFYYDDPDTTPPAELRSAAGVFVPEEYVPAHPDVVVVEVPAGEYAVGLHKGSYEGLGPAWSRFYGQAIPATGREMRGAAFELYLNNGCDVPPDELLTELVQGVGPNS